MDSMLCLQPFQEEGAFGAEGSKMKDPLYLERSSISRTIKENNNQQTTKENMESHQKKLILEECSVGFVLCLCQTIGKDHLSGLTTLHLIDVKSPDLLIKTLPQLQELVLINCQIEPSDSMRKALQGLTDLRSLTFLKCRLMIGDALRIYPFQVGSKVMTRFQIDAQSFMCLKPLLSPILSHITHLCLSEFDLCSQRSSALYSVLIEYCGTGKLKQISLDNCEGCQLHFLRSLHRYVDVALPNRCLKHEICDGNPESA